MEIFGGPLLSSLQAVCFVGCKGPKEARLELLNDQRPVCRRGMSEIRGRNNPEVRVTMGPDHVAPHWPLCSFFCFYPGYRDPVECSEEKQDMIRLTR